MTQPLLTIYKASAGSGKTFTLAAEYLCFVLSNPDSYRHILAVTFTNKATGEMKERILTHLHGIATGNPSSDSMLGKVRELLRERGVLLPDDKLRQNAQEALTKILHNYSFFHIETIDSFMLGILRNLAKELELGNNMEIELDAKKVVNDGVQQLLRDLKANSKELSWIVEYMNDSMSEEKHWNVTRQLCKFANNIYKEDYQRNASSLEELLRENASAISTLKASMQKMRADADAALPHIADEFFRLADANGLTADDFNGKSRGPWAFFDALHNGKRPNVSATLEKFRSGSEKWSHSKSPHRAIVDGMDAQWTEVLRAAVAALEENTRCYNTAKLVTENLHQLQLIGSIRAKINDCSKAENRFLLADTCQVLMSMVSDADTSFIYEKTGTEIHHILIDEFQDTSGMQWANFLPLLTESTANNHRNLIVGDVKQSIYRWRGSDSDIMSHRVEERMGSTVLNTVTLDANYRSCKRIVEFNNGFFRTLIDNLVNSPYAAECDTDDIVSYYADVKQNCKGKDGGSVRFLTAEADGDDDNGKESATDAICRVTVEQIVELLDAGLWQSDIAVLVRSNEHISSLATWVTAHPEALGGHDIRIVSGEAFRLENSVAVGLLVRAMRWIANKADVVSLASLAIDYHRHVLADGLALSDIMALKPSGYGLPQSFLADRERLSSLPLYELASELYRLLDLARVPRQDAWLQSFFDELQRYVASECGTLTEFLTYWDETLASKNIPSGGTGGIVAMTIHKSKGLEFHSVIVPIISWKVSSNDTQWIDVESTAFNGLPMLPITRKKEMANSAFSAVYRAETQRLWIDNLNLLYVAFTRPTSNLIVVQPPHKEPKNESSSEPKALSSINGFIEMGLQDAIVMDPSFTTSRSDDEDSADGISVTFHTAPVDLEFRQSNSSKTYINRGEDGPVSEFIERGNLLHDIFAHIDTAADVPAAVERLYTSGVVDAARRDELLTFVSDALRQPEVADWFSGRYRLYNECTVLTLDEGEVRQNRPDRVMRDDSRTIVVDFKFGKPKEEHHRQVQAYMQLLARMGFPQVEGYLWYVNSRSIVKI